MIDGTAEDYELVARYEQEELAKVPDRIIGWLRDMDDHTGYQVTRLGHSLQAATRALRAGEDEEMVVCALVHDVGDMIAPANHSQAAAAVVRPYVSDRSHWIIQHHGVFQGVYWFQHLAPTRTHAIGGRTIRGIRHVSTSAPTTTRTHSTLTIPQSHWNSSSRWFDVSSTRVGSRALTLKRERGGDRPHRGLALSRRRVRASTWGGGVTD